MNLDSKKSLCFSCKHGLCMLQESEVFIKGDFPHQNEEEEREQSFLELPEGHEHNNHYIETKVCGLCFWSPANIKLESPIILTASVHQCSRYSKRNRNE